MRVPSFSATQIPSGSRGGYTSTNSAVSTVTSAIQTPNTYYWLQVGAGAWECTWYNFADISLWSDYGINKSIYDPCPYGYRVPNNGSWTGFPSTTWTANTLNEGAVWNSWWPTTGYRHNGFFFAVGYNADYWSSTRYSLVAYLSYSLDFRCDGYVAHNGIYGRGSGFTVRCVQEEANSELVPKQAKISIRGVLTIS